ncbi:hypothetical protein J2T10_004058 [Paenarthrobacter nicotinovorans]|uniref:Uncharacterized protein n=1 Tax=Paenarthrobacter nicotinovorans TaxID=29320 RepID=A0ABT9TT29_PAENI|nr:hypothetical protein [Paenarthrobacter nicotinovorans]
MNSRDIPAQVDLASNAEGVDRFTAPMRVLIGHLQGLTSPQELTPLLEVAREYWGTTNGDPDALFDAKAKCWEFLDPIPIHQHLDTPEARYARALLCVLDPPGDGDIEEELHDTAEWFAPIVRGTY